MSNQDKINCILHAVKAMCVMKNEMVMFFEYDPSGRRRFDGFWKDKVENWKKQSDKIDELFAQIEKE